MARFNIYIYFTSKVLTIFNTFFQELRKFILGYIIFGQNTLKSRFPAKKKFLVAHRRILNYKMGGNVTWDEPKICLFPVDPIYIGTFLVSPGPDIITKTSEDV